MDYYFVAKNVLQMMPMLGRSNKLHALIHTEYGAVRYEDDKTQDLEAQVFTKFLERAKTTISNMK